MYRIDTEPTAITTPTVATARTAGVYNLQGQRVSASRSAAALPAGMYVVDGKKIVVR